MSPAGIHPEQMPIAELLTLQRVNQARGAQLVRRFVDPAGNIWDVVRGFGGDQPWVAVHAGHDLGRRTERYISGPGNAGVPRRRLNADAARRCPLDLADGSPSY